MEVFGTHPAWQLLHNIVYAGPGQAANVSGEIIWMVNGCLRASQRGVSSDLHPLCLLCGTGSEAGGRLSQLYIWFALLRSLLLLTKPPLSCLKSRGSLRATYVALFCNAESTSY